MPLSETSFPHRSYVPLNNSSRVRSYIAGACVGWWNSMPNPGSKAMATRGLHSRGAAAALIACWANLSLVLFMWLPSGMSGWLTRKLLASMRLRR